MANGKAGAPIGNINGAKGKLVTDAIRKSIVQDKGKQLHAGVKKLMASFADGEPWAIEQVMNRLEGKPAQGVTLDGDLTIRALVQATPQDERI